MGIINTKNKERLDSITIGSGHSIMAGYIPPSVEKEKFIENYYKWTKANPESISRFGFWGGDIDYNTYYPNLNPDELKPKDDEFIEPIFRLLSETIVSKNYNPTDFSQNGVLKASMKLLLGQTVNCDHETNIGNAIGSVSQVIWQEAYKDGNFIIPAGINGVLKIDGKANPRIARGILMEPPSIHSNSVTVQFKWDKSHPGMDDHEFFDKLGTYDSKGQMVRRVVTEVVRYLETSLVSHGADPFAQKVNSEGKIINPNFAKRTWSSYSEYQEDTKKDIYITDYKTMSFKDETPDTIINNNSQLNQNQTMNELEQFLLAITATGMLQLGEGIEVNKDNVTSAIKALIADRDQLRSLKETLQTEKSTLTSTINDLNAQVANLTEMATVGKNHIANVRLIAVNNYKKLKGDQADETIVNMLNSETTGLVTLESLNKEYMAQLDEKFPLHCAKCGSLDINRASSQTTKVQESNNTIVEQNSDEDPMQKLYKSKINKN